MSEGDSRRKYWNEIKVVYEKKKILFGVFLNHRV